MSEEEKPNITEEIARIIKEQIEREIKRAPPPPPTPKPVKKDIDLYCERSHTSFPLGSTTLDGWLYICDLNCSDENIVESLYAETVYCHPAEKFYGNVALVLTRGDPVTFDRDYFVVRLPRGKEGSVKKCITEGVDCEKERWFLLVGISRRAVIFFTTDPAQLDELFNIQVKSPFMKTRGADAAAHAIIESVKDMETLVRDVVPMLDLTGRRPGAVVKAMKTYTAISEAIAQIITGCMAFGSDFVRQNMRFMACGNFVPIPYLLIIIRHMKECGDREDMECMKIWIDELDKLIDAYRHPGPPYRPPEEEKDIFRFRRPFT